MVVEQDIGQALRGRRPRLLLPGRPHHPRRPAAPADARAHRPGLFRRLRRTCRRPTAIGAVARATSRGAENKGRGQRTERTSGGRRQEGRSGAGISASQGSVVGTSVEARGAGRQVVQPKLWGVGRSGWNGSCWRRGDHAWVSLGPEDGGAVRVRRRLGHAEQGERQCGGAEKMAAAGLAQGDRRLAQQPAVQLDGGEPRHTAIGTVSQRCGRKRAATALTAGWRSTGRRGEAVRRLVNAAPTARAVLRPASTAPAIARSTKRATPNLGAACSRRRWCGGRSWLLGGRQWIDIGISS